MLKCQVLEVDIGIGFCLVDSDIELGTATGFNNEVEDVRLYFVNYILLNRIFPADPAV